MYSFSLCSFRMTLTLFSFIDLVVLIFIQQRCLPFYFSVNSFFLLLRRFFILSSTTFLHFYLFGITSSTLHYFFFGLSFFPSVPLTFFFFSAFPHSFFLGRFFSRFYSAFPYSFFFNISLISSVFLRSFYLFVFSCLLFHSPLFLMSIIIPIIYFSLLHTLSFYRLFISFFSLFFFFFYCSFFLIVAFVSSLIYSMTPFLFKCLQFFIFNELNFCASIFLSYSLSTLSRLSFFAAFSYLSHSLPHFPLSVDISNQKTYTPPPYVKLSLFLSLRHEMFVASIFFHFLPPCSCTDFYCPSLEIRHPINYLSIYLSIYLQV
ncbi:unnamed protein product [Acanthosepion pharaonis]|uniref:Uncharacterized protein n=1 Tax=Acanthosepion pharaonis TaxID=158019 RepID=A0A812E7E0_ACAPH|nr:unnamed protein product [Sepia pharaonis]